MNLRQVVTHLDMSGLRHARRGGKACRGATIFGCPNPQRCPASYRSGGEYRNHVLRRAVSRSYYLDRNRVGPGRPVVAGGGDCPFGFRRVILAGLAGAKR